AMGKSTNALEEIIALYRDNDSSYLSKIDMLQQYHLDIIEDLEQGDGARELWAVRFRESGIKKDLKAQIESLKGEMLRNQSRNYSFVYDQVVGYGELLSTKIVAAYLNACDIPLTWLDARKLIATDRKYRDAGVDWKQTTQNVKAACSGSFLTQGFIGSDDNGFMTTLGREGSDYTAAIMAHALNAESVTIWKDVPGVLNADPRVFNDTILLEQISYSEAIELAFYGASVIHPKTLQPLQDKNIPLYVKSFLDSSAPGTVITEGAALVPQASCFIVKKNLVMLSISSRDFSFIGEHNISHVFQELSAAKMQVGLIQNSAISFTICVEDKYDNIDTVVQELDTHYKVSFESGVSLYTVRHYEGDAIASIEHNKKVLLRQRTQETLQLVVQEA
ncbi:MAG: aspartate kinase, partial [Nonlabens sp.]|nr:aspartate kinase [Nonlabens sp.]